MSRASEHLSGRFDELASLLGTMKSDIAAGLESAGRGTFRARAERRCHQCWQMRTVASFLSRTPGATCAVCRERRRSGKGERTGEERRAKLIPSPDARPRVLVVENSKNVKLGGIPSTTTTSETCPDACSLKGAGCYAEYHLLAYQWGRAATRGLAWEAFLDWVSSLPRGQLWRHNTAGDLPGKGDVLDVQALDGLAARVHAGGSRAFSFTHKPLRTLAELEAVAHANRLGFTINISADSLEHADYFAALEVGPVASLVAPDTRTGDRTPAGQRIVVCPAQLHDDVSCAKCQLCSHADRRGVVGFIPHGQMSGRVVRRLQVVQ